MSTCVTIISCHVIQYQEQSNLAFPLLVKSKWTNGFGWAHEVMSYGCTFLPWVTKCFFQDQQSQFPSLDLTFWKTPALTICHRPTPTEWTYRMAWHRYIPLPNFSRPVVRYAYRYSMRRWSRLTVIILDLSKCRKCWDVAAQKRSF